MDIYYCDKENQYFLNHKCLLYRPLGKFSQKVLMSVILCVVCLPPHIFFYFLEGGQIFGVLNFFRFFFFIYTLFVPLPAFLGGIWYDDNDYPSHTHPKKN